MSARAIPDLLNVIDEALRLVARGFGICDLFAADVIVRDVERVPDLREILLAQDGGRFELSPALSTATRVAGGPLLG